MKILKNWSMSKWPIILVISLTIFGCRQGEAKKMSQEDEFKIIEQCIERLQKNGTKGSYLVSPQFDEFDFNTFFKNNHRFDDTLQNFDDKKDRVLDSLNWTVADFNKIKEAVNNNYLGSTNLLLQQLSNSGSSERVYYFSGIHENLVFVNEIYYYDSITTSHLISPSFNRNDNFHTTASIIFILKDGKVKDMIVDNGVVIM